LEIIVFITLLRLKPQPGKQDEVIEILRSVEDQTRLQSHCIDSGVFTPCLEGDWILYFDRWSNEEDLYRHIQSRTFHWILLAMELASEPPEISFHEITSARGMELIEWLRMAKR
jgi:quinol monooxygenase YgiN